MSWRFFPAGELPQPDPQANVVRLVLQSQAASGTALAATVPVTYTNETLTDRLGADDSLSLVPPNLLNYVPCVEQPPSWRSGRSARADRRAPGLPLAVLGGDTSPFESVVDLYRLERLSLSDSPLPPGTSCSTRWTGDTRRGDRRAGRDHRRLLGNDSEDRIDDALGSVAVDGADPST